MVLYQRPGCRLAFTEYPEYLTTRKLDLGAAQPVSQSVSQLAVSHTAMNHSLAMSGTYYLGRYIRLFVSLCRYPQIQKFPLFRLILNGYFVSLCRY